MEFLNCLQQNYMYSVRNFVFYLAMKEF